jgi:hypothetical protein
MKKGRLACYSTLVALSAACGGTSTQPPDAPAPTAAPAAAAAVKQEQGSSFDFKFVTTGGNAIVFVKNDSEAVVGPVARQPNSDADFNLHDMDLLIDEGVLDTASEFAEPDGHFLQNPYWRTAGYDIEFCEDGVCSQETKLDPLNEQAPASKCSAELPKSGGVYYVPDMMSLHPGSKLGGRWRDKLATRVTLRKGGFAPLALAPCFEFQDSTGKSVHHDSIIDGDDGLLNSFRSTAKSIDVVFSKDGARVKVVRVRPNPQNVVQVKLYPVAHFTTPAEKRDAAHYKDVSEASPVVTHFKPFYELFDPATIKGRKLTLRYKPAPLQKDPVNPGPECPQGRFRG